MSIRQPQNPGLGGLDELTNAEEAYLTSFAGLGLIFPDVLDVEPYLAITALRTLDTTDYTVDCTANTFTVTLPTAVGTTGRIYVIKNSGAGVITVDGDGTETIDEALTAVLSTQYEAITIQSNGGTGWIII